MNHGSPSESRMASELAPSEFAIPVPACPLRAIINPVIISGVHPPMASTVSPNTDSGMENVWPAEQKQKHIKNPLIVSYSFWLLFTNDDQHPED